MQVSYFRVAANSIGTSELKDGAVTAPKTSLAAINDVTGNLTPINLADFDYYLIDHTVSALGAGASTTVDFTHGLGSDVIGVIPVSVNGSLGDAVAFAWARPDGKGYYVMGAQSHASAATDIAAPSTGDIAIKFTNWGGVAQDVTVKALVVLSPS